MSQGSEPKPVKDELPDMLVIEVVQAVAEALKNDESFELPSGDFKDKDLQDAVVEAVSDALDITPLKAVVKAWGSMAEVAELIGPDGPQDGQLRKVKVTKHKLKVTHKPEIHIKIGRMVTAKRVVLTVLFTLNIEGLILSIKDREIRRVSGGHAQPEVKISVEKVAIFTEKLPKITLPVEVHLYDEKPSEPLRTEATV